MLTFYTHGDEIILEYKSEYGNKGWIADQLKGKGQIILKRTFYFDQIDMVFYKEESEIIGLEHAQFVFARKQGSYWKVKKGILMGDFAVYLHESMKIRPNTFTVDPRISIFRNIEDLVEEDIYIGGEHQSAIPLVEYTRLIKAMPTSFERLKYAQARVSTILREYVESTKDAERKYNDYMKKKVSRNDGSLEKIFKDQDLFKYETIRDRIERMLQAEDNYTEKTWQDQIVEILLLLYPKYILALKEAPIKKVEHKGLVDFMLVDADGHVDVVEIKKPFKENNVISYVTYRNNHIPMRELSGSIMQIEKYIFHLNRWGAAGEQNLTEKYKGVLPNGLSISITNPSGIVIIGRDNKLSAQQRLDFEVVKRKYNNVIDILTYDDLLRRLNFTIRQIQKR